MKALNRIAISLLGLAVLAGIASAQPQAHLGYAFPAGGQVGTTVDVKLGGQFLQTASGVYISGDGVTGSIVRVFKPPTGKQETEIRDKLQAALQKLRGTNSKVPLPRMDNTDGLIRLGRLAGVSEEDIKNFIEYAKNRRDPKRQQNAQLQESVYLRVAVGSDAKPGLRDIRIITPGSISNPVRFVIGRLPERVEGPQDDPSLPPKSAPDVGGRFPLVLNGQVLPGSVDRYTFEALKGERLVIEANARLLVPYLADAVPGWFQAVVAVKDEKGNPVAYADHYGFEQDPAVQFDVPKDGKYTLEIHDALYRGREDFVYRVTVGEIPFLTSVYPLGGHSGQSANLQALGWNLASTSIPFMPAAGANAVSVPSAAGDLASHPMPFVTTDLPEVFAKPNIGKPASAQGLRTPVVVNGRISKPGESQVFCIEGKAGTSLVAEVWARRLGSPMDSVLTLTDSSGKVIAFNDDTDDRAVGMVTHQADSYFMVSLPHDGSYFLTLRDAQQGGGLQYGYRLRVSPPLPDFELRIVPSSVRIRPGGTVAVSVVAIRRDGFAGEIALKLLNAPKGVELRDGKIPAGATNGKGTLRIPLGTRGMLMKLAMEGVGKVDGKEVHRAAIPAEELMQAFAYKHLVPTSDWLVKVMGG